MNLLGAFNSAGRGVGSMMGSRKPMQQQTPGMGGGMGRGLGGGNMFKPPMMQQPPAMQKPGVMQAIGGGRGMQTGGPGLGPKQPMGNTFKSPMGNIPFITDSNRPGMQQPPMMGQQPPMMESGNPQMGGPSPEMFKQLMNMLQDPNRMRLMDGGGMGQQQVLPEKMPGGIGGGRMLGGPRNMPMMY